MNKLILTLWHGFGSPPKKTGTCSTKPLFRVRVLFGGAMTNVKDRVTRTTSHTNNNYRGSFFEELHKLLAGDGVMDVRATVLDGALQNLANQTKVQCSTTRKLCAAAVSISSL